MSGRPWKSSLKILAKNFVKHFKGLPEIKDQNQLHIWNQHEKYYKIWYFQNANPKFAEKKLVSAFEWILSELFKGLLDIREENQIHIWNQHAKNYQTLCFQNFDPFCLFIFFQYSQLGLFISISYGPFSYKLAWTGCTNKWRVGWNWVGWERTVGNYGIETTLGGQFMRQWEDNWQDNGMTIA